MADVVLLVILVLIHSFIITTCYETRAPIQKPEFSAILVFGDSTVDPGNNNYIGNPLTRCNHSPYGRNFPNEIPTGRCTNGKLVTDFIAYGLSIKDSVPPFLDPNITNSELRTGVSFAFGGSGYDEVTAAIGGTVSVSKQIDYFKQYIRRLKRNEGEAEAEKILKESLVIISAGTNDMVINFYDIPARRLQFNISSYQGFLHGRVLQMVSRVYGLGCRNIVVAGLPPIGCLPIQMTANFEMKAKNRKCVKQQNSDSKLYNRNLAMLLSQQEAMLPRSRIVYADVYDFLKEMAYHPKKYGMKESKRGCCGTGYVEVGPLCTGLIPTCPHPSTFLFWDAIHPTESANRLLAHQLLLSLFSTSTFL